ncbi:ras-related protein Rab-34 [Scaptodrosophila lebanonensis]|uniref:Ras-related protein Rab-36 n=1 Tax=Drosophila lebanonensis TaxID=7225 RepID=A0A6J2TX22_DROLE|nr:ras-related protein Rab-34 [Scaptodrosophila lebanonensis]
MPHLLRQNIVLPAPPNVTLHDPRTHLRRLPPPYSVVQTPHNQVRDFAPQLRYQLELPMAHRLKLRPCKVIFVGDCAVGKTAIVNRFCYDKFQSNYKATIGVDFELENFKILGHNFSLEMWDTAGQERFKCIAGAYYRNASVVVATYDMSKRESLDSAKKWLSSALMYNTTQRPLVFLVGTKADLLSKEEFMSMERLASVAATQMHAEYWSVSARSGYRVTEFFQRLAALAFEAAAQQQLATLTKSAQGQVPQLSAKSQTFDLRSYFNNRFGKADTRQRSGCTC